MKQSKKQVAKLQSRISDYYRMLAQPGNKVYTGYKKPGSNKK